MHNAQCTMHNAQCSMRIHIRIVYVHTAWDQSSLKTSNLTNPRNLSKKKEPTRAVDLNRPAGRSGPVTHLCIYIDITKYLNEKCNELLPHIRNLLPPRGMNLIFSPRTRDCRGGEGHLVLYRHMEPSFPSTCCSFWIRIAIFQIVIVNNRSISIKVKLERFI